MDGWMDGRKKEEGRKEGKCHIGFLLTSEDEFSKMENL